MESISYNGIAKNASVDGYRIKRTLKSVNSATVQSRTDPYVFIVDNRGILCRTVRTPHAIDRLAIDPSTDTVWLAEFISYSYMMPTSSNFKLCLRSPLMQPKVSVVLSARE